MQASIDIRRRPPTPRPTPQRSPALAHLSLPELRSYRRTLASEEDRVSYWRRILQARLDLIHAGEHSARHADAAFLSPVLADDRVSGTRTALLSIGPADDIPPLPNLAELWERPVADDPLAAADLTRDLRAAEQQLSAYRSALHGRIGEATGELIARYREQPGLCLSVLPLSSRSGAA